MKFRKNRKGFTIVELIIVIAVIAVLTAILVPTFIHLANKAGTAADETIVKNANTQLAMKAAEGRRNYSMSEAVDDVDEIGYHIPDISTNNGNKICWDFESDRFVLFSKNGEVLHSDAEVTENKDYLFTAYSSFDERNSEEIKYGVYAKSEFSDVDSEGKVTLSGISFDSGDKVGIKRIDYSDSSTKSVVIGTNSTETKLYEDAPNGTVYHAGLLGEEYVKRIKDGSHHEHGRVGFAEMESGNSGRYVAESRCEVVALYFSDENNKYTKLSGAKVEEYAPTDAIKSKIELQLNNDEVIVDADKDARITKAVADLEEEIAKEMGGGGETIIHVNSVADLIYGAEYTVYVRPETDNIAISYYLVNSATYVFDSDITSTTSSLCILTGSNVTFDLNGHKVKIGDLSIDSDLTAGPEACSIYVQTGATFTVNDSVGSGKLCFEGGFAGGAPFALINNQGTMTVNGGDIYNLNTDVGFHLINVFNSGSLIINGGSMLTNNVSGTGSVTDNR